MTEAERSPLLEWLLRQYPDTPKSRAKQWILAGRVTVNGEVIRKPHHKIAATDSIQLGGKSATTLECGRGWQIHPRVSLLYLDSSLAVVNKGPGLISVPAPNCDISALSILADFLAGKLKAQDRGVAGKTLPPPYRRLEPLPVHRLDQYTSGVFCMATNPEARHKLIEQLRERTMKRKYVAFVQGHPPSESGTWRHWLRLSDDELRQRVLSEAQAKAAGPDALEAITHYRVVAEYPPIEGRGCAAKLQLRLESGRKHQIRVQAAHEGFPLIGDRTYNPDSELEFTRQALHAEMLTLDHPESGKSMSWVAEMPKDLRQLEAMLRTGKR